MQISYAFMTNPKFMAQYGFNEQNFVDALGEFYYQLPIIGIAQFNSYDVTSDFLIQIVFYITSAYLQDALESASKDLETNSEDDFTMSRGATRSKSMHKGIQMVEDSEEEDEKTKIL